jgi:hypothetical protein
MFFAHILPKGRYPDYRLRKDNVMLLTSKEHYMVDHDTGTAKQDRLYDKFFSRFEELKAEAHGL